MGCFVIPVESGPRWPDSTGIMVDAETDDCRPYGFLLLSARVRATSASSGGLAGRRLQSEAAGVGNGRGRGGRRLSCEPTFMIP
jgi:hypothetical protein